MNMGHGRQVEQEEEFLTNNLQKKLHALQQDKARISDHHSHLRRDSAGRADAIEHSLTHAPSRFGPADSLMRPVGIDPDSASRRRSNSKTSWSKSKSI
jgi:hypothetical protein